MGIIEQLIYCCITLSFERVPHTGVDVIMCERAIWKYSNFYLLNEEKQHRYIKIKNEAKEAKENLSCRAKSVTCGNLKQIQDSWKMPRNAIPFWSAQFSIKSGLIGKLILELS